MVFKIFGLKAVCLAATVLLIAACETPVDENADAAGSGGSKQTTMVHKHKSQPKIAKTGAAKEQGVLPGSQEDLVLNVGNQIQFGYDKSNLQTSARRVVERWAEWMQQYPAVTVTIEGHCDERGTRDYNLGLGERRADSARKYLIALGINGDRIGTISYGKERPHCVSSNEDCYSQNRRDMLVVN